MRTRRRQLHARRARSRRRSVNRKRFCHPVCFRVDGDRRGGQPRAVRGKTARSFLHRDVGWRSAFAGLRQRSRAEPAENYKRSRQNEDRFVESMKRWPTVLAGILITIVAADAAQISGKVIEANGNTATVKVEGGLAPAAGDSVEIFFTLAGSGDEVSVAKGTVTKVDGDAAQVGLQGATGQVEKGQLVRINSDNPQKLVAAPTPTPAPDSTSEPATALGKKSVPPSPPSPSPRNPSKATPKPAATMTPPAQEKKRFAGKWRVLNENPSYTLVLSQNGNKVTGTYDLQDGSLRGEVHGDVLVAKWWQTGNQAAGAVRLKLSNDGETLSGPWTYDAASLSRGFTGEGMWTLRRIGAPR
jgi:hypothetical protein